ncbi:MAG: YqgE/AlgH family protein [Burkholderiales bacterium]|nr:YqgE/AlgH family protein [Burkholderiales bacterium]
MVDPYFSDSVVLITEHKDTGAAGFVINKQLDATIQQLLMNQDLDSPELLQFVYWGGPVGQRSGAVIHNGDSVWQATEKVLPDISVTLSMDIVDAIASGKGPDKYIVTLGYSGWSPGQLEDELAGNAWLTAPASSAIIYDTPLKDRYEAALKLLGLDSSMLKSFSDSLGHA